MPMRTRTDLPERELQRTTRELQAIVRQVERWCFCLERTETQPLRLLRHGHGIDLRVQRPAIADRSTLEAEAQREVLVGTPFRWWCARRHVLIQRAIAAQVSRGD